MPLSQSEKEANLNPLINNNNNYLPSNGATPSLTNQSPDNDNNNNAGGGRDDGGKIEDSKDLDMKASTEVVKHDIVSSPEGQGRVDN